MDTGIGFSPQDSFTCGKAGADFVALVFMLLLNNPACVLQTEPVSWAARVALLWFIASPSPAQGPWAAAQHRLLPSASSLCVVTATLCGKQLL